MPLPLFVLAVVAMIGLAILRLVRVRMGRTALPEGKARALFLIAFLVLPPVALKAVLQPSSGPALGVMTWVPMYGLLLALRPGPDDHRRHDRRARRCTADGGGP